MDPDSGSSTFGLLQIHDNVMVGDLTMGKAGLKYRKFRRKLAPTLVRQEAFRIYDSKVDRSFPKP